MPAPAEPNPSPDNPVTDGTHPGTDETADPGICPWCRTPVPPHSGRGRPRVWCNDQCRRDAHNARKAARDGAIGMQVIRQTRTIEKPVTAPTVEHPDPHPTATPARHIDEHELTLHVLSNTDLLARILNSFATGLGPRLEGRTLTGPLHDAALRLAPLLDDYRRRTTDDTGLTRQQRRARQRLDSKNNRR